MALCDKECSIKINLAVLEELWYRTGTDEQTENIIAILITAITSVPLITLLSYKKYSKFLTSGY